MPLISGNNADEVWLQALRAFGEYSPEHVADSRTGPTLELLHVQLVIGDPRQRWVLSRNPPINPAFAIAECFWMLAGRDDAAFLTPWNSQLRKFVGTECTAYGAYGKRLRQRFGFDQLGRICEGLSANRSSRQFVLQIWDPSTDLPDQGGQPRGDDIPCNICSILKIRSHRLEWLQVLRSNDLVLGLPYDIVQFTMLQEILAGWLGVEVGAYVQISDSLHIYDRDLEAAKQSAPKRCPLNPDSLALPKRAFDHALEQAVDAIGRLADPESSAESAQEIIDSLSVPSSYRNLLTIVAAEAVRRGNGGTEIDRVLSRCDNPLLLAVWREWLRRYPPRAGGVGSPKCGAREELA
jgi:thymidylate synthase